MRRRELLGGLFALSATAVLNSCRANDAPTGNDAQGGSKKLATLKVILQGPFAVVVNKNERNKITAVSPTDPAHQLRFRTPMNVEKSASQYSFVLGPDGLEISGQAPRLAPGLDGMNFDLGPVHDLDKNELVAIDLPAPDVITFIPPAEPVVFVDGRRTLAPLNHVLEYRITDLSKVTLRSKQLGDTRPLAFSEMYKAYEEHRAKEQEFKDRPGYHGPQSPNTQGTVGGPSPADVHTFFLGVGIPPEAMTEAEAVKHALAFFNDKLVPLFPKSPNLKKIKEIGGYGQPGNPDGRPTPATAKPTAYRTRSGSPGNPSPRLLLVTGVEECRAAGLTGTTP
jgi:hypothetical protein